LILAAYNKDNNPVEKNVFIKHSFGGSDLPLVKITVSFAEDFVDYLMIENGINTNTAHKYLKNISFRIA